MEKHICKLCSRSFSNGRALGGHMRSHVTALPPSTQPRKGQLEENESASSSSSEGEEEEDEGKSLYYGLRENPKKSFRLVDPEFSFAVDAGSVVQDRESETESSRIPVRHRRSKRQRRSAEPKSRRELELDPEPEPLSSVSDTTPEGDVALCLMMLSRDVWMRDSIVYEYEEEEDDAEEEEEQEQEEEADEEEESPEELKFRPKRRGKYQCGTCKKVFRSYQALGGHRASHKKIKGCSAFPSPPQEAISTAEIVGHTDHRRIHECPVCFRVFRSGQALGGHKRSHLTAVVASSAAVAAPAKFNDSLIDLNLPAPVEDDDISQVEISAVSDAEFVDLATK